MKTQKTLKTRMLGFAALTSVLLSAGCSSVPDAVNPVEWYKSTVDLFASDADKTDEAGTDKGLPADTQGREAAVAKADSFPKVGDVPEATADTKAAERQATRQGLVADREQRRYASAPLARQTEDGDSAAPAAPVIAATGQPAPPPMPVAPVRQATVTAPSKPAPQPTAIASAPPPPPASVQETFRDRLADKFKPVAGQDRNVASAMPTLPTRPANSVMPNLDDTLPTVVISSDGVSYQGVQTDAAGGYPVTASMNSVAMSNGASQGSAPLTLDGATKLATILFPVGSSELSDEDMRILTQVSRILKDRGGRIRVVGHASSRTRNMDLVQHKMVNFQVSAKRADQVAVALVKIGVAPELITVVARSDSDPLYYEVMPSGEAGNRRTEIYLDS